MQPREDQSSGDRARRHFPCLVLSSDAMISNSSRMFAHRGIVFPLQGLRSTITRVDSFLIFLPSLSASAY